MNAYKATYEFVDISSSDEDEILERESTPPFRDAKFQNTE